MYLPVTNLLLKLEWAEATFKREKCQPEDSGVLVFQAVGGRAPRNGPAFLTQRCWSTRLDPQATLAIPGLSQPDPQSSCSYNTPNRTSNCRFPGLYDFRKETFDSAKVIDTK